MKTVYTVGAVTPLHKGVKLHRDIVLSPPNIYYMVYKLLENLLFFKTVLT